MTTNDELATALDRAEALPDGEGKVAELERIVAHADALGDARIGLASRFALIGAYNNHAERWKMLAPFGWCLAAYDRDPELFDQWDAELLRWYYKWAIATLRSTPRVGLAQTIAAIDDMERRFREGGHSLNAVYNLRCRTADHLGDLAGAQRFLELWQTTPRDENSDCEGCDPSHRADLFAGWGDWARAVDVVEPVLNGAVGCVEQPERALAAILEPYLRLGRFDDAARAHVRAYRRHRHERDAFPYLGDHMRFCVLTDHHERGLEILTEHLGWLDVPFDDMSAMEFSAAGSSVCRLATRAGHGDRAIARPEHTGRAAGEVTVERLGADLAETARQIAARFDTRNGTDHQSRRVEAWLADEPLTTGLELPAELSRATIAVPDGGRQEVIAPLTIEAIVAILNEHSYRYVVEDETVVGQWGEALIRFGRTGQANEILHARVIAQRQLPSDQLARAYAFCNAWNHDSLLPKAYVHDDGEGELFLAGDVTVDLEHGVAGVQLAALIDTAIATGVEFAQAAADLPDSG